MSFSGELPYRLHFQFLLLSKIPFTQLELWFLKIVRGGGVDYKIVTYSSFRLVNSPSSSATHGLW